MRVLAIETATDHPSVVLVEDGQEVSSWREVTQQDLCRRLAAEAGRVLENAGRRFAELDLIAVGLGPGSFTSLRVGLATAKAFAFALGKPLVGVSSLQAMAWQMRERLSGLLCPVLDAKRGELYTAVYRISKTSAELVVAEFVGTPDQVAQRMAELEEPTTVFGQADRLSEDDAAALSQAGAMVWRDELVVPDALAVADLGLALFRARGADDIAPLRPIYVRMSYAEEAANIDLGLR